MFPLTTECVLLRRNVLDRMRSLTTECVLLLGVDGKGSNVHGTRGLNGEQRGRAAQLRHERARHIFSRRC